MRESGPRESAANPPAFGAASLWRFLWLAAACGSALLGAYAVFQLSSEKRPHAITPVRRVNLEEPPASAAGGRGPEDDAFRMAVAPVISPEQSLQTYQDLANYLARKLGRKALLMHRRTYAEINDLVRFRECDLALVCTFAYIRGRQDFGMQSLAAPMINGETAYRSYILARPDDGAASLLDFRDRSFAFSDMLSNTGWLYPTAWLIERGEKPRSFFKEHVITGSHDRSVAAVSSGQADGAAVASLIYDFMLQRDPSLAARVKVVQRSAPFGTPPIVVHPGIDANLKGRIRDILLDMHNDPVGRAALSAAGIDRFVAPDDSLYDEVRRLASILDSAR